MAICNCWNNVLSEVKNLKEISAKTDLGKEAQCKIYNVNLFKNYRVKIAGVRTFDRTLTEEQLYDDSLN